MDRQGDQPQGTKEDKAEPVLMRSLAILDAVAAHDSSAVTVKEIAEASGIPLSTAYRLVSSLTELGLLWRRVDGTVQIGWTIYRLAREASRSDNLIAKARPVLKTLSREVGETAFLAVQNDDKVVLIAKHEIDQELRASFDLGGYLPIPKGALGKVAAAFNEEFSYLLDRSEVDRIRKQGYALSDQLAVEGVLGIAAPVFDFEGRTVGAITVAGPTYRFKFSEEVVGHLLNACKQLSLELGWK